METGSKARRMPSLPFSPRLASLTRSVTLAPAGTETPFVPLTASASVAFTRSPTLAMFVHTLVELDAFSSVPAAIVPVVGDGVTLLVGAGAAFAGAGLGAGLGAAATLAGVSTAFAVSPS